MSMFPDKDRNAKARKEMQEKVKHLLTSARKTLAQGFNTDRLHIAIRLVLAALLLDFSSTVTRSQIKAIPTQDIKDATNHLDIIE